MRLPLFSILLTCLVLFISTQSEANNYDREIIKSRVEGMKIIVKPKFTPVVEGYIKGYLARGTTKANIIMGRSTVYFPIFEKYLEEHDMPKDLKYLSVLESALNPIAVSPVGAGGLWQFMKETGKVFGLNVNSIVDERSCAHRSTEAAMKYLSRQYSNYGNWELALAAYNCGAGNLNKAIRRARTNDYWKLSKYIPKETRNFIPAFIGAAYMVNFSHTHNVQPRATSLDMQLIEEVLVFSKLDFTTIAAITALPVDVITTLNPTFKKGYIPDNPKGYYVLLPKRVIPAFKDYLDKLVPDQANSEPPPVPALLDSSEYKPEDFYTSSTYVVLEGDKLDELAKVFGCSDYHLQSWNNLSSDELVKGQEITVWFPKDAVRIKEKIQRNSVPPAPKKPQRPKPIPAIPLPALESVKEITPRMETPALLVEKTSEYTVEKLGISLQSSEETKPSGLLPTIGRTLLFWKKK